MVSKQFISRIKDRQSGPLSFEQEGLWFLNQLDPSSPRYNVARALRLRGNLAIGPLQAALDEIVRRHESLRSHFTNVNGIPMQVIGQRAAVPMTFIDLSDKPDNGDRVRSICEEQVQRPFDLSADLMLRACLVRLTESDHVLLVVVPHITCDGWSLVILFRELLSLYEMLVAGQAPSLPELPIQYLDYAAWQRQWLTGEVLERQLGYWRDKLSAVSVLDLPTDRLRTPAQSSRNGARAFRLSKKLSDHLKALSRAEKSSFFMTLLAAFKTLLYRYTNQSDLVIGFPIANRRFVELEGLIGFFANTLVLRSDLSGNPTFRELLGRIRDNALTAYEYQDLPFEKLVEEVHPQRDLSRNPLFQVAFQLRNYPDQLVQIAGLTAEPIELRSGIAKFDLSLAMKETADGLSAEFEYKVDLFESASIERMFGHLEMLLQSIAADPGRRLSELTLLTEPERRQLIVEWNTTRQNSQNDKCIHQLFEEQVDRNPDATAVVCGPNQLTYRELNRRANQLAHLLKSYGVKAETLVGVCLERSTEMILAMLAILKAGGAYVPLDPVYPRERMRFILRDTQAAVLLTEARLIEDAIGDLPESHQTCSQPAATDATPLKVICLDKHHGEISKQCEQNLAAPTFPKNLAYVIYTSGSTGTPKGVMIEHRSAAAFLDWAHSVFTKDELAGVVASTSICFDLSVFEIFAPLTTGGRIILVENALALAHMDSAVVPTLVNTVPSGMTELLRLGGLPRSIRTVNLAGEPLKASLVLQIDQETSAEQIYDLYGPSETTTYSTYTRRSADGVQTIGRPIAGTQIYILDPHGNLTPVAVPGEIHISGAGLARGYLNRPELTAEKFIANPFGVEPGARLYRTGDIGRYLPDGNIELIGRKDGQVKIRGFRIELGEIESVLSRHPKVREAVVVAREDRPGDKRLTAYVVGRGDQQPQADELKQFLKATLPDYMVPSAWVSLASLPHTPNGKINRAALPAPDEGQSDVAGELTAPSTNVEKILASIWAEVLRVERVGIRDNFFDLGGHSLLAMQVLSRLRSVFSAEIPLRALFESPTIEELAQRIVDLNLADESLDRMLSGLEAVSEQDAEKSSEDYEGA
jgi:amino acid adenylation domain-containing protein